MSNGVEVIVAGDKTTLPGGHPNTHLRILTTTTTTTAATITTEAFKMPLTLAPSTLKDHMLLMLPSSSSISDPAKTSQVLNELQLLYNRNQFVTKTCLTTYTYSTTYVVDGTTKIESREKVITNTATEERNAFNIQPTATSGITLTQTPHLGTGVFKTTYTYLNTVLDGDQPVVVTSQHTVTNTITAPEDYLSILQPSEPSTRLFETNTYYNTMVLTKTLTDNDISKVISTTDIVKQVVITELLPSKSMSVMTSYIAIDAEGNRSPADNSDILSSPLLSATDVVKTFFVTYTYFNTYLINGSTIVRTNMSTSSVVATEKLYIYPTTKRMPAPQMTTRNALPIRIELVGNNIGPDDDYKTESNVLMNGNLKQTVNLYATKTFATTFTYFTTLLQDPSSDAASDASATHYDYGNDHLSTVINSHTRIVENVVTESIPLNFLPTTDVHKLKLLFFGDEQNEPQIINEMKYTTLATLIGGQSIEITAVKSTIDPTSKLKDTNMQSANAYLNSLIANNEESSEEHLIDIDNTKNELENDQEVAETSNTEELDTSSTHNKVESNPLNKINNTKIKTQTQSPANQPISSLIGSINFNGLKVLRPMIDAVAGLIKPIISWNNDSIASNTQTLFAHHTSPYPLYTLNRPHGSLPPIPEYIENLATSNQTIETIPQPPANIEPVKGHARNPIYIPVNGNKEIYENIENLTPVNFLPPEIVDHSQSSNEIRQTSSNQKNKPILDSGIPISPGDVITANSDVIFGKPTGNRPRIPLNRDTPVSTIKTITNGNISPESFSDSHSISSVHSEKYIGPPPPLPQQKRPYLAKATHNFNKIPVLRNKPMFLQNKQPPHEISVLPPHHMMTNQAISNQAILNHVIANQVHINRIRAHQSHIKEPNRSAGQQILHNIIPIKHDTISAPNIAAIPTSNHIAIQAPARGPIPPNIGVQPNNDMHKYVLNNVAGGINDIIEIQRIPEVFSTDLPPMHIYHAPQEIVSFTANTIEPSRTAYHAPQEIQTINQLPEVVESATGQPLFVNIQPSQIAKVVIPHGSSSALIFGGVQELHKSGEYFDDPYPNGNDQVISIHVKPSVVVTNNNNVQVQDINNVQAGNVSVISNQNVNVDSHVLSQDVDMHAPPIIFRNQDTNDIPITSGTYFGHDGHQQNANMFNNSQYTNAYHHAPPTDSLIQDNNRLPFIVDVQNINIGMSNENDETNVSGEVNDQNLPVHSQAPSINEQFHIDQHKEDDYENEHGEVIQESNSVPQLISSDQSLSDNLKQIPYYTKQTKKTAYKDHQIPFTQTEANSLWSKYPSVSELYPTALTTERSAVSQPSSKPQTLNANRQSLESHEIKLQMPVVPALVNDMYAPSLNHTQTTKPIKTHNLNHVSRNPNNRQVFYHQTTESRPSKFGKPHHITLQNLPVPPHFAVPLYEPHRPLPPALPPHHSRRPIQKPFSRYPTHNNKPIITNYSTHQADLIKQNWQSSKPFNANHFASNTLLTTTRNPTSSMTDQTPQTSEIDLLGVEQPFVKPIKPESGTKITHYMDPLTNITQAIQDLGIYDLSRGKPFIYSPQRRPTAQHSTANLNIGEEKRPVSSIQHTANETKPTVKITQTNDHMQINDFQKFESITENSNKIVTTDHFAGMTNAIFVPFDEKIIDSLAVSSEKAYPKTPATEMQPPPTHPTSYKPFIQKHVSAISPTQHHQNVLIEEVMGLHPPPVPKSPAKKPPSKIPGNFGILSNSHKQNAGHFTITAPTPHPTTHFITHYDSYASTQVGDADKSEILTSTPEAEAAEIALNNVNRLIPYFNVEKMKPITKSSTANSPEITTAPIVSDDYVRFSIDSNTPIPNITTQKPFKITSNGHMPQSPQLDESSFLQPSQHHIFAETMEQSWQITSETSTTKMIQPTATLKAETVKATRSTSHDTKMLTITTTRTTVRSQGITSTILLTLTRTKTSTIVDTITQTLVNPTRVTHEPTIKPTIFTAPITIQKVSGSMSSVVPNPAFSIYAIGSAHDESEHEHDSSNVSSEENFSEMDDLRDIQNMIQPTPKIFQTKQVVSPVNNSNESIFVVMTDRKNLGTININADIFNTLSDNMRNVSEKMNHNEKMSSTHEKSQATLGAIDDVSTDNEDFFDNLPKRDEDDNQDDVSHILLGGILIATPPRSSEKNGGSIAPKNPHSTSYNNNPADEIDEHLESHGAAIIQETRTMHDMNHDKSRTQMQAECQLDCKAINNEICQITGDLDKCVCRPGFARMFLDRPCKPTYTYTLHLAVLQLQSQSLKYEDAFRNPSSPKYSHLMQIVHDAIDRMVMQSELRDIYHGVHISGFRNITQSNATKPVDSKTLPMRGIETEFHLQLSDNSKNEEQIMNVFKTYLKTNNFNLGGTNLYSSLSLIDYLRVSDFDECMNSKYHDCSENALCFNLRGTYTCSCKEGFVDMSENPLYPGRACSARMTGCSRCNYHGSCVENIDEDSEVHEILCECFHWYAGNNCQYSLKVLLVGMIALGGILFALLLICIILTCWKHNRPNSRRGTVPGIDILPHKTLTVHGSKTGTLQDRRAMIEDTSSETSEDSLQLPYVTKKQQHNDSSKDMKKVTSKPTSAPPKSVAPSPPKSNNNAATLQSNGNSDSNHLMTVMIPRAKYYSQQMSAVPPEMQCQQNQYLDRRGMQTGVATATQGPATMFTITDSIGSTAEAKLLSYLDASPSTSKSIVKKKTSAHNSKCHLNDDSRSHYYPCHSGETGALVSAGFEVSATVVHDSLITVPNSGLDASSVSTNKKTTDHLADWLTHVPEHELIISEARSYGETLVHPQTKTLIQSSSHYRNQNTNLYDKPSSTILMDDVDMMAERDLGSTFLLPHTHLYKSDRASDISGFDSL